MSTFSQRYGYKSSVLQLETASDTLKRRILAAFYKQEFDSYDTIDWTNYTTGIEDMMIEMGVPYEFPKNELIKKRNAEALQKYIMDAKEWYVIFDFTDTTFMDSSGIGVIMGRYKRIYMLGGEVCAVHTSERMKKILTMSGVTRIMQIYEEDR